MFGRFYITVIMLIQSFYEIVSYSGIVCFFISQTFEYIKIIHKNFENGLGTPAFLLTKGGILLHKLQARVHERNIKQKKPSFKDFFRGKWENP